MSKTLCYEQEKRSQYHSQVAVYKMLTEQYRQSERLRHDMKNHIIVLSALSQNKEWECDIQMPKGYFINEFDLCVLFGNILDNALEACGRMQCGESCFINIQAKTVKKCFLIEEL